MSFVWGIYMSSVYMNNMDEIYYINIRNTLLFREGTVRVDADGNLLSLAVISEGFYCALLNTLMGWNLINANSEEKNASGIDLIDRGRKIALQVSLTCDHKKVQRSIDKFKDKFKSESYDGWHFFFVPIKRDAPHFREDFSLPEGIIFDKAKDVLSTDCILSMVQMVQGNGDIAKLIDLSHLMDKYTKDLASHEALCKRLYDRLCKARDDHPSFRLMGEDGIDKQLFPHTDELIPVLGSTDGNVAPIWEHIKAEQKENFRHIIIEGDGGIGKSVSLLSVTEDNGLLTQIPAIYIHMYDLVYGGKCLTLPEFLAHNADHDEIDRLCGEGGEPKLMLLLDGLNELSYEHQSEILRSVRQWAAGHRGAQLIITSRPIPGRNLDSILDNNVLHIKLTGLEKEKCKERLTAWNIPLPNDGAKIWETLKLPLFLTLYAKTARLPKIALEDYPLDVREVKGPASLIWNYLQRELLREENTGWFVRCAIACEYISPYIAYRMSIKHTFELGHDEAEQLVEEAVEQIDMAVLPTHLNNVNKKRRHGRDKLPETDWFSFVLEQSGIFVTANHGEKDEDRDENGGNEETVVEYAFMHQNFRDCLAGLYLVNQAEMAKEKEFPELLCHRQDYQTLSYAAELIEPEIFQNLWEANRRAKKYTTDKERENHTSTCNLLELCRLNRNLGHELNYSGMDLRGFSFNRYFKEDYNYPVFRNPAFSQETYIDRNLFDGDGHLGAINILAVHSDGRFASGGWDGTIRVWDPTTGQCLCALHGNNSQVTSLSFLGNNQLISGTKKGTVCIWDLDSGKQLSEFIGPSNGITCMVTMPNGEIVCGGADSCFDKGDNLFVIEESTGKLRHKLIGHSGTVQCLAPLSDTQVVSGSDDGSLRIWDTVNGRCIKELRDRQRTVRCLSVLQDGRIVAGFADSILKVWSPETNHSIQLNGHRGCINCVSALPDGRIVSGSEDSTLRVWDSISGECVLEFREHSSAVHCIDVLPDGTVASGSGYYSNDDCVVWVWDSYTGACIKSYTDHSELVRCVCFLSEQILVSASNNAELRVRYWKNDSIKYLERGLEWTVCLQLMETDKKVECIAGTGRGQLQVWNLLTGKHEYSVYAHRAKVNCLTSLPRNRVASGSDDGTIVVLDLSSKKITHVFKRHVQSVSCIDYHPAGYIISSSDNLLYFWSMESKEHISRENFKAGCAVHKSPIVKLKVLSDGRIVTCSTDGDVIAWDPVRFTAKLISGNSGSFGGVIDLKESYFITAGRTDTLLCWNYRREELLRNYSSRKLDYTHGTSTTAAFLDGRVVCGLNTGDIQIWSIDASGSIAFQYQVGKIDYPVMHLTTHPDGTHIICADNTHQCELSFWNSRTCERVRSRKIDGFINAIAVTSYGLVVCGTSNSTVLVWDPNIDSLFELDQLGMDVSMMDFSCAVLSDRAALALWQNGAVIPELSYEETVKPFLNALTQHSI